MTTPASSRRVRYMKKKLAAGLCRSCGQLRDPNSAVYCTEHHVRERERLRRRAGYKPWRPGHRGRPPKVAPNV